MFYKVDIILLYKEFRNIINIIYIVAYSGLAARHAGGGPFGAPHGAQRLHPAHPEPEEHEGARASGGRLRPDLGDGERHARHPEGDRRERHPGGGPGRDEQLEEVHPARAGVLRFQGLHAARGGRARREGRREVKEMRI